jgi:hypothetical protein
MAQPADGPFVSSLGLGKSRTATVYPAATALGAVAPNRDRTPTPPLAPAERPAPAPMPMPEPAPMSSNNLLVPSSQRASSGQPHSSVDVGLSLIRVVAIQSMPTVWASVRAESGFAGWVVGGADDPVLRPD